MTLKERRDQWERGLREVMVVTHVAPLPDGRTYDTVYVLLSSERPFFDGTTTSYHLHRYFTVAGEWECSVDLQGKELPECLAWIDNGFRDHYPRED